MDRVGQVDADAAMHVLGPVAHPVARLAGQVAGGEGLGAGRQAGVEAVNQLPQAGAQRLDVHVGVGEAHLHGLEAADGALELHPLAHVGHRAAHLLGADAKLQGRQGRDGAGL